ncbi:MAG: hypothetical protein ACO2ZZ_05280 [Cyclobacteriaceae bacterium]
MNSFSPGTTYSLLLVMFMIIGGMYVMSDVLHIESYREDHHVGAEDSHGASTFKDSKKDYSPIPPTEQQMEKSEAEQPPIQIDSLTDEEISFEIKPTEGSTTSVTSTQEPAEYFDQLIENYRKTTLAEVPDTENRTDLVVRYYPHDSDEGKVKILSNYGFYLHERAVDNDNAEYRSNSIFYGDNIKSEDIQLIAYLLLQNNVAIKQIVPSKFHDGWKANSIEIGADVNIVDQPALTLVEVQSFSNPYYKE